MNNRLLDILGPERALIFRIVHKNNISMLFRDGLHCSNSVPGSKYTKIGNEALISKRPSVLVPVGPGGCLADYVPFYFTPYSPMLFNIKTGHNNIKKRGNEEIVILVSSLPKLHENSIQFVFTDRHAYLQTARFETDLRKLDLVRWDLLRSRDFHRDLEEPEKVERYQAEALAHRHVPAAALLWVGCYNDVVRQRVIAQAQACGLELKVVTRPGWYF